MTVEQFVTIAGSILAAIFIGVFVVGFGAAAIYLVIERGRLSQRGFQESRGRSGRRGR